MHVYSVECCSGTVPAFGWSVPKLDNERHFKDGHLLYMTVT